MKVKHWLHDYLGKKWSMTYDCFAHFVEVQENHYGINTFKSLQHIPQVLDYEGALDFTKHNETVKYFWKQVDKPKDGDAIIFGIGTIKFHIGTYLAVDTGGVLHCSKAAGVTFTPMRTFKQRFMPVELILRHREM